MRKYIFVTDEHWDQAMAEYRQHARLSYCCPITQALRAKFPKVAPGRIHVSVFAHVAGDTWGLSDSAFPLMDAFDCLAYGNPGPPKPRLPVKITLTKQDF